jgi:Sec-independent protein secretion pathway component TatC
LIRTSAADNRAVTRHMIRMIAAAAVLASLLPTIDPVTLILEMLPLIALYENGTEFEPVVVALMDEA